MIISYFLILLLAIVFLVKPINKYLRKRVIVYDNIFYFILLSLSIYFGGYVAFLILFGLVIYLFMKTTGKKKYLIKTYHRNRYIFQIYVIMAILYTIIGIIWSLWQFYHLVKPIYYEHISDFGDITTDKKRLTIYKIYQNNLHNVYYWIIYWPIDVLIILNNIIRNNIFVNKLNNGFADYYILLIELFI